MHTTLKQFSRSHSCDKPEITECQNPQLRSEEKKSGWTVFRASSTGSVMRSARLICKRSAVWLSEILISCRKPEPTRGRIQLLCLRSCSPLHTREHPPFTYISAEFWCSNKRYVPPHWSHDFPHSRLARKACDRCIRTSTHKRYICELLLCTLTCLILTIILEISWGSCENLGVNSTDPNLQCGFLQVPMDYHDDTVGTARLAAIKYSAFPSKKMGTIFFNPGNPPHPSFTVLPTHTPISQVDPASLG